MILINGSIGEGGGQILRSGPTTHEPGQNGESYIRIHGPNVLTEFAPQDNHGGYKMHTHT